MKVVFDEQKINFPLIGKQLIFTSSSDENLASPWVTSNMITLNKLYTVGGYHGIHPWIVDDKGENNSSAFSDLVKNFIVSDDIPKFEPISLVLESTDDVDFIMAYLGKVTGTIERMFGDNGSDIAYNKLKPFASQDRPFLKDALQYHRQSGSAV